MGWLQHRRGRWVAGLLVLAAMVAALWWPLDYIAVKPGLVEDLKDVITVEGGDKSDTGRFYLTAVLTQPANVALYLRSLVDPTIDMTPKQDVIPEGWTQQQYNQAMLRLMDESKTIAEVVALRQLGYQIEIQGGGAQVVNVLPYSPVKDIVLSDDIIVAFNAQPIHLTTFGLGRTPCYNLVLIDQETIIHDTINAIFVRDSKSTMALAGAAGPDQRIGLQVITSCHMV